MTECMIYITVLEVDEAKLGLVLGQTRMSHQLRAPLWEIMRSFMPLIF